MDFVMGDLIEFELYGIPRQAVIVGYTDTGYRVRDLGEVFTIAEDEATPVWTRWDQAERDKELEEILREGDAEFAEIMEKIRKKRRCECEEAK